MKILITTFTYPPNKDGVAEACRAMAEGLVLLGWEVWVATSMGERETIPFESYQLYNGVHLVHFKITPHTCGIPSRSEEEMTCLDFVSRGNFDLIVNQCWDTAITLHLKNHLQQTGTKKVLVSHGYGAHIYYWHARPTMGIGLWLRGLRFTFTTLRELVRTYDQLVFLSSRKDFGRFFDHLFAEKLGHRDIRIIPNGVDTAHITNSAGGFRKKYGIEGTLMVLCVANYSERKNQRLTVEVFRKANVPGSVLVCIGSELNDYGKSVLARDEELAEEFRDCKVLLLDQLDREETGYAFADCDLFLLTAKAETQPIVLIEAMAACKPWISTDTGCVSEMPGGLVCGSKKKLVSSIRHLLSQPAERARLGKQGRRAAESDYDSAKNARRFDTIFRSLASQAP